jgi:hypothetical protein
MPSKEMTPFLFPGNAGFELPISLIKKHMCWAYFRIDREPSGVNNPNRGLWRFSPGDQGSAFCLTSHRLRRVQTEETSCEIYFTESFEVEAWLSLKS